nr:excalibur calcium-binding domain-containing protein [Janibacter cremeus]
MAESRKKATRTRPCTVRTGSWTSRYDNRRFSRASDLDIDHVVALKEAWESGASSWSAARRQGFANDLGYGPSLIAVSASTNRSKSDRDPAQWMPRSSRCWYAGHWVAVKWRWGLKVDRSEKAALKRALSTCSSRTRMVVKPSKGKSAVVARPQPSRGNDPRFGTCSEAISAGYGPYRRGSVEYGWYRDGDKDGIACER